MVLIRWDPFFEISRAHRLANRRLVGFPRAFASYSDSDEQRDWSIPLDIVRDGDNLTVTASLPGVKPEDIDVTIEGGVLSIKADTTVDEEREDGGYVVRERRAESFRRTPRAASANKSLTLRLGSFASFWSPRSCWNA